MPPAGMPGSLPEQTAATNGAGFRRLDMRADDGVGLRHVRGGRTDTGTLSVGQLDLVWHTDRGRRRGDRFVLPLESIEVVGRHQGLEDPGAFVVGVTIRGEFEALLFLPLSTGARHLTAAERAFREVRRARNARMAAWRGREDAAAGAG